MLKVASWNVNSIKVRLPAVLDWLGSAQPDVVLLQETKSLDEAFPRLEIEDCGYNLAVHGQKTITASPPQQAPSWRMYPLASPVTTTMRRRATSRP